MKDILDFVERHWGTFTILATWVLFGGFDFNWWPFHWFRRRTPVKLTRGEPGQADYLCVEATSAEDAQTILDALHLGPPSPPVVIVIGKPDDSSYISITANDADEAQTLLEQAKETAEALQYNR